MSKTLPRSKTRPRLTLLPGGGGDSGQVTDNQAIDVDALVALCDQQPASQPMSLAQAMFSVRYTHDAFHVARREGEYFLALGAPAYLRVATPNEFPADPEGVTA